MKLARFISLIAMSFIILCFHLVFAGTTGKIMGVITDSENKEAIPGSRVIIEGTTMGANVNPIDGSYVILNVPPGTYSLVGHCIGYNKLTVTNVLVQADVTTEQDFELVSEAINMDSIVVIGRRPDIDKFEVSSVDRMNKDEIASIPAINIEGIIKTQTGFVSQGGALHVRGSRAGELAFVDDGVLIRDQLGGYGGVNMGGSEATPISRMSMNMAASDIEDVSIMKGNYPAEYGDMAGGLVTTTRKEGSNKYTQIYAEFKTDDLGFPSLNDYSFDQDIFNVSMGGPLPLLSDKLVPALGLKWPGENMAYYTSFSADKSNTWVDYNDYPSLKSKIDYGSDDFWGMDIPRKRVNKYSGLAKLTWKMDPNSRYKLNLRYSKEWSRGHNFSWTYLYTPETATRLFNSTEIKSAKFSFNPPFLKDSFGELLLSEVIQTYERKPGGLTPTEIYSPIEWFESYYDANDNGQWDNAEEFEDINGDGIWGEPYTDYNYNGQFDPGIDTYVDINGNGQWDPEPYIDSNGNGIWDPAEQIAYDVYYVDVNGDGAYDDGDSVYVDEDGEGNGIYDPELRDIFDEDMPEPYFDGDISLGEPFIDGDGNGIYTDDTLSGDYWDPADDYDISGDYTGPNDEWSEGIPFLDRNGNGYYDPPNGYYDYGEAYTDVNGNGKWDSSDNFLDRGYDRWAQYHYDYTRTRTIKFDITSQVDRHHGLKTGFEFRFHRIDYQDMQYPYYQYNGPDDGGPWLNITRVTDAKDTTGNGIVDEYVYQTYSKGVFRDFYVRTPKDGAFYIQDKIEYGELVANLGMRYEFFIQAREAKDSLTLITEGLSYRQIIDAQYKFVPRIGFSFPISEKAKLMFNYGHFYQRPGFVKFYQRRTQATNAVSVFGNPNLDYEKTILYEVGVQYILAEGYRLDVSGFYKDQYGLLNTVPESLEPNAADYQENSDYARSRGLELELEKRYGQILSGSIKYEYTWAFGKSSSDRSDYYIRIAGGDISIKENPLDWDIRHQLTVSSNLNVNKGEHPHFGIFKLPDDWSLSTTMTYKSGRPFTPSASYPGLGLGFNENPQVNSKRYPATSSVDIMFDKNFQMVNMNFTFSVLINNAFNAPNIDYLYTSTGMANTNMNFESRVLTGMDIDLDPTNYGPGRQIMVGLSVKFN
ncbi:MAG: TonB-dependent receptor [candidate division Zixibacteria bacterium]|nr:TonB-dependent receptor [candidate division Zixibacteria bacterium]